MLLPKRRIFLYCISKCWKHNMVFVGLFWVFLYIVSFYHTVLIEVLCLFMQRFTWVHLWMFDIPDLPAVRTAEATCLGKWGHYFNPKNNFCYLQECRTVLRVNQEMVDSFIHFGLQKSDSQGFISLRKILKQWGEMLGEEGWQLTCEDE